MVVEKMRMTMRTMRGEEEPNRVCGVVAWVGKEPIKSSCNNNSNYVNNNNNNNPLEDNNYSIMPAYGTETRDRYL